ncbi:MAG: hypothetical protein V4448_18210 [Pseudomonadota bacterium]
MSLIKPALLKSAENTPALEKYERLLLGIPDSDFPVCGDKTLIFHDLRSPAPSKAVP